MPRKLPQPLTREELDIVLTAIKEDREKRRRKRSQLLTRRGERIHAYYLAVILAAHAGLRISEILGLGAEVSKCCKAKLNEITERSSTGRKLKVKICTVCGKKWESKDILRSNTEWDILPLSQENIKDDRIFISRAKGEKDRWAWKPKLLLKKDLDYFPLKVKRRALQVYFAKITEKKLGKPLNFHLLRHTFATEYLKKHSGDIRTLQILMGHSRIDTTSVYTHVSIDDALEKVKEVF